MKGPANVGLVSPGWPAGAVANGIVTYVANMRQGLAEHGVRTSVIAFEQRAVADDPDVLDVNGLRAPRALELAVRAAQKVTGDPCVACLAALGVTLAVDKLRSGQKLELLEAEESFGYARLVQRMVDIPVVVRLHGPWFLGGKAEGVPQDAAFARRVRAEGRAFRDAVGVTSPAKQQLDLVREHYGLALRDAVVIPNPAPTVPVEERWQYEACDQRTILCVGRFDLRKGADIMVRAFRRVAEVIPDAELCLVGPDDGIEVDGTLLKAEAFLDRELPGPARARVRCLGKRLLSEIPALRRQSFVTAVASRYENHPLAVLEALAYGCPLVAARTGGIPEIVREGETGLMFESENADELAARLIELYQQRDRAQDLARAAARSIERDFSTRAVARTTLDYYAHVLDRFKPREARVHPGARALTLWSGLRA